MCRTYDPIWIWLNKYGHTINQTVRQYVYLLYQITFYYSVNLWFVQSNNTPERRQRYYVEHLSMFFQIASTTALVAFTRWTSRPVDDSSSEPSSMTVTKWPTQKQNDQTTTVFISLLIRMFDGGVTVISPEIGKWDQHGRRGSQQNHQQTEWEIAEEQERRIRGRRARWDQMQSQEAEADDWKIYRNVSYNLVQWWELICEWSITWM